MMCKATAVFDRQLFDCHMEEEASIVNMNDSSQLNLMISGLMDGKKKKPKKFQERQMLRNPGTKEGQEKVLETESRVIQLVAEGDDWWTRMSKGATLEQRSTSLLYINEMIDGESVIVDLKTNGLSTRATNINNTLIIYGHPTESLHAQDSLKGAGIWIRLHQLYDQTNPLNV